VNAVDYAKSSLESSLGLVNIVMQGITEDQYNWKPEGNLNTVALSHVHICSSVDFFINGIVRGGKPGWSAFAEKQGLPANPREIFKHGAPVPLSAMQEYEKDTTKAVLDFVGTLKDDDLDRKIDTQFFGTQSVAWLLQLTGSHSAGHAGDMASVKGMQGLKGLPF
jgi:hypothetical protein